MSGLFKFLSEHQAELFGQIYEHLWLTFVSLALAIIISVPTGILLSRNQKLAKPVLGFVNVIQTIPSIALLGFMIPLLGIGEIPAIVALFLYALLPIIRNTYIGLDEVNQDVKEAASGMGMTPWQSLRIVEIPLALPTIFAGIRTATVINIGVATLAALIGAGGLGEFIFRGIALNNMYMVLAGAIPAAMLAVTFDFLLGLVQKHILKINLKKIGLFILFLIASGTSIILLVRSNDVAKFRAGLPTGFLSRQDGFQGLKNLYNLDLDVVEMQPGLMYDAIKNEEVDIVAGFSTDGRIEAFDLVVLEDDKKYFPPYYAAPVVRNETLKKFPELEIALEMLGGMLNNETMASLNYQADDAHDDPRIVAASFLDSKGIETGKYSSGNNPDIIVGSKDFTESYILAEMFKIVIENYTNLTVDLKTSFGGTKLVFDALNNANIDLYPEYSGTGLLVLLPEDDKNTTIIYQSDVVYDYVKQKFNQHYNLTWLSPLGFNNTHAILMRRKQAELLNIETISDLSKLSQKQ